MDTELRFTPPVSKKPELPKPTFPPPHTPDVHNILDSLGHSHQIPGERLKTNAAQEPGARPDQTRPDPLILLQVVS